MEYVVKNTTVDLSAHNTLGATAEMTARFRDEPWVAEVIEIETQKRMSKEMHQSVNNDGRIATKEEHKG